MTDAERARFDSLMDDVVAELPTGIAELLSEISVIVLDEPSPAMLADLGLAPDDHSALDELCGLHTGTSITERSVEHHADLPTTIHLFRRGIIALAGGWQDANADDHIYEEIRITLLHEIGHHFGLDEDDLERLGYD